MLEKEIEDPRYTLEKVWGMIFEKVFVMEFVFQKNIVPVFTVSSSVEHWSWSGLFPSIWLEYFTNLLLLFLPMLLSSEQERYILFTHIKCGEFEDESKRHLSLFSPREYFYGSFLKSSVLFYMRKLVSLVL